MIKINLLPKREVKKAAIPTDIGLSKDILLKLGLPVGIAILLVIAAFAYMEITKSSLKNDIEQNKKTLAQLQQKMEEVKKFEQLKADLEAKNRVIKDLRKKQDIPFILLRDIAKLIPDGVWLTFISYGPKIEYAIEGSLTVKETKTTETREEKAVTKVKTEDLKTENFIEKSTKVEETTTKTSVELPKRKIISYQPHHIYIGGIGNSVVDIVGFSEKIRLSQNFYDLKPVNISKRVVNIIEEFVLSTPKSLNYEKQEAKNFIRIIQGYEFLTEFNLKE